MSWRRSWRTAKTALSAASPKCQAGQRTVAALLRQTPSAVQLVAVSEGKLQQKAEGLVALGCMRAAIAKLAWRQPEFLSLEDAAARLKDVMVVLRDELGLAADEVLELASKAPGWLSSNLGTLRERAVALAQVRVLHVRSCTVLGILPGMRMPASCCTTCSQSRLASSFDLMLHAAGLWQRGCCRHVEACPRYA